MQRRPHLYMQIAEPSKNIKEVQLIALESATIMTFGNQLHSTNCMYLNVNG
jgi:hypothetical protein